MHTTIRAQRSPYANTVGMEWRLTINEDVDDIQGEFLHKLFNSFY